MYVTVSLMRNSKAALPWTMFNVSSEYTFAKLLEDVELHLGSNSTVATCSLSATCLLSAAKDYMPSQRVTVDLSFYVVECCTLNGRFILYSKEVVVEQEHSPNPQKNVFVVMMMAAKELKLPPEVFSTPERYEVGRGDHRLHDDIIDFLKGKCLGFSTGTTL